MNSRGVWVLVATIIGSSMAFIDGTVINVALPAIQRDFRADVSDMQWIVEAYALFLAALILVGGSLGDRLGRRRIFAYGIVLFAIASVWAALAPDITQLILARAAQGVGAAILTPGSLAIISTYFSGVERGRAIGTWSAFTAITTALGPVLGGLLVEHFSWRWVFLLNIPLAVFTLVVLYWKVPESRDPHATGGIDGWGALLVTLGLGGVVFGLVESGRLGLWHPLVLGTIIAGSLALIAFVVVEHYSAAPMMPLHLFHSRTFTGTNLLTLVLYAALGTVLFFLPFNLIQVQGYSATAAGASLLPFVLLIFLLSRWAGGIADRHGARLPLIVGPALSAVGFVLYALPGIGGSYWLTFFPAIVVQGLGMAICVAPLTTAVMGAAEERYAGVASGISNAVSRVAMLFAIAIMGVIVLNVFNTELDSRLAALNLAPETLQALDAQRIKLAAAEVPAGLGASTQAAIDQAIAEAFVEGFRVVMLLSAGLALLSALIAALTIRDERLKRQRITAATEKIGL